MSELEQLRLELAEFFCEDTKTFRLDDCIKTFHEFFQKFHKATQVWHSLILPDQLTAFYELKSTNTVRDLVSFKSRLRPKIELFASAFPT